MSWLSGDGFHVGAWTSSNYAGLGILFENLPTTGEMGGSPLLNDGGVPGDEVRWELVSVTGLTVDEFNENGSFTSTGTGSFVYTSYINGSDVGDFTVTAEPETAEQNQSGTGLSSVTISGTAVGSFINEQHQAGSGVVTSRVSGTAIGSFINEVNGEQNYAGSGTVTTRISGTAAGSFVNEQRQSGSGTVRVRVTGTVIGSFINEVIEPPATDWGDPVALFNEALPIEQISLTFDQLGRPLVFYRTGADVLKLYWYDPVLQESVNVQIATGIDPTAGFDFPQDTGQSFTDALLFYVRGDTVYMRVQRDRFATEYLCPANQPGLRITSSGLRVDNRYQVVYQYQDDGYTPPVVPVPEIPVLGDYYYLVSWGSCLVTNYRLDVVNDPFKIGFTVRDAFFPRYTEARSGSFPYQQYQVMFGSDDRQQFYGFISRDTRSNRAIVNIWRGGNEYSNIFTLDDFNGVWEFEFLGIDSQVIIKKDGNIVVDAPFRRPRPDRARPTLLTFAGGLFSSTAFHGIQHDCWVEHDGNRIDWAVQTKGEAQQPSVPAGTDMTIHNHRVENWRFIQP